MRNLLYLALGAFPGALCRYGLTLAVPAGTGGLPLPVLLINWIGCLFLGWFFAVSPKSGRIPARVRLMIGTGFTGTFTTFSAFTVDSVKLLEGGEAGTALLYMLLSLAGGIALSAAGVWLGKRTMRAGRAAG
ncbi:fluoride efflux transporter CrcB [Paenibacillus glufosinatiresistens]|uniref:fluoride efflux transporter CrcB n=1 Tax=Paenibacillus glufosinatiresistens TaxID=3070657 RepID=UPI00286E5905|nr:fluoride efflux transporter CrcB [Paenibacillus sp. YX.27]